MELVFYVHVTKQKLIVKNMRMLELLHGYHF
jgi:hypothetical protein